MAGRLHALKEKLVVVLDLARVAAAIAVRTFEAHWIWDRTRGKRKRRRRRR